MTISSEDVKDRLFPPNDSYYYHNFAGIKIEYYHKLLAGEIERDGKRVILTHEHKCVVEAEIKRLVNHILIN